MTDWFFDPLLSLHYEMMVIDIQWPFGPLQRCGR